MQIFLFSWQKEQMARPFTEGQQTLRNSTRKRQPATPNVAAAQQQETLLLQEETWSHRSKKNAAAQHT